MTSNKGLLSQLQEIPNPHPHFLVIQPWVSSMVMCVLEATIVLKGVHSQAHVHQVEYRHILKEEEEIISVMMFHECVVEQKYLSPLSFP